MNRMHRSPETLQLTYPTGTNTESYSAKAQAPRSEPLVWTKRVLGCIPWFLFCGALPVAALDSRDLDLLPDGCAPWGEVPDHCAHTGLDSNSGKTQLSRHGCHRSDDRVRTYVIAPGDVDLYHLEGTERTSGPSNRDVWFSMVIRAADRWNSQTQGANFRFMGIDDDATLPEDFDECEDEPVSVVRFVRSSALSHGYAYKRCVDQEGVAHAFEIQIHDVNATSDKAWSVVEKPSCSNPETTEKRECADPMQTLIHEFGHTLNLAHIERPESDSIMKTNDLLASTDPRIGDAFIGSEDIRCANAFVQPRSGEVHSFVANHGALQTTPTPSSGQVTFGTLSEKSWWGKRVDRSVCEGPQHLGPLNILTCIDGNFADADDSSAMTGIDAWKHLMLGATPIAEIDWGGWERKGPVLSYGPRVFWTSVEMVPAQEAEFFLSPTDATDFTHDLGHPVLVGLPENGRALRLRACERWSGGCLETKPVLSAMRIGASTLRGLPVLAWTDQATGSVRNGGVQISVGSFTDTLLGRAQALDGQRSHVGPGLVCGDDIGQGYDCVVAVADGDDPRAPIVIRRFNVNAASRDIDVDPVSYALPLNLGTASDLALWRYDGMLTIAFRSMLSHQWIYVFSIDAFDPVGEVKLTWIRDVDTADVGPNGFSENPGGSSGLSVVR